MGAIKFIISETSKNLANIEFTKAMLNMKSRGETETTYTLDSNIPISRINHEQVKKSLTRDQLAKYKNYSVIYGYHRLAINDNSFNASQPFEDPILHKIREYPELRTRVNRRLLCNGEIYNYDTLVAEFSDKDIQSTSDVEIILPLYIKYGLDYVLNKLDGDYTFILTENINTIDLDSMNVFAARDIFGNKPLYYITNKLSEFYMFVTELKGIPQKLLQNNQYTVSEFPIGSYWSFQNPTQFTKFYDWEYLKNLDNCIINSTDPNQINSIYTNIESLLTQSIIKRVKTNVKQPIGILVSGGFDSSIGISTGCSIWSCDT